MKILVRTYGINDFGESDISLRSVVTFLTKIGNEILIPGGNYGFVDIQRWAPDLVIGQQWATEEASLWATRLGKPFVMFVYGPQQYEHFMPQCDLVVFTEEAQLHLAQEALGQTPSMVLHLPHFRNDCSAAVDSNCQVPNGAEGQLEEEICRRSASLLPDEKIPTDLCSPAADLVLLSRKLQDLAEKGRRRPTLSLCMTVANEAETLEKAVASVATVVDDIIIGVDRRSSDETAAIARRLADQYFEFSESATPNFPQMRNRALQRVQTDWAIVLDGHEWIENSERIPAALETTAWSIEIKTLFEPDENRVPSLSFPFPRVHRRHVRFTGAAAHEEVSTPLAQREPCPQIIVWHERKPGPAASRRQKDKSGSEIEVLRSAWIQQNDRRALFYMANGLREAGRFREAIKAYEEYLQAPNFEEEGWQAMLFLARCHAALNEWSSAQTHFEKALLKNPERAEAAIGLGHVLLQQGSPREAAAWFRMATGLPEPQNCRLFVEVPAYRWQAWHGLALALDKLDDYAGAVEAETKAKAGGAGTWADQNIDMWQEKSPC